MDEVYNMDLLRQSLIDSEKREGKLNLELLNAQHEVRESQRLVTHFKGKVQELDDALEAEEAKTNDECSAKEKAEERARQHQREVLTARRKEEIANEHSDAAETEFISLQQELSMERSATLVLREKLHQSESNEMAAYDLLHATRAKVTDLQQDLTAANNRIYMLELHAAGLEETIHEKHQQLTEAADHTPSTYRNEIQHLKHKLKDPWEKHNPLESQDEERKVLLSALKDQAALPTTLEMPALPVPATLRPRQASVSVHQVEPSKDNKAAFPAPRVKTDSVWKKCPWKVSFEALHLLLQSAGRC